MNTSNDMLVKPTLRGRTTMPPGRADVRLGQDRPSLAEEAPDDRDQDDGDDHSDDELEPAAREDDPRDHQRGDADQNRDDPAHRVGAGVEEPPEPADDGANDDEPYPVHAFSFLGLTEKKRPGRSVGCGHLARPRVQREDSVRRTRDSSTLGGRGWRRRGRETGN